MKTFFIFSAVSLVILAVCVSCYSSNNKTNENASNAFAVVELFTSEGCSSCPPADDAVARILKEYKSNVYVLGYHVDYWNTYGWKDMFSSADFTRRQESYAKTLQLSTIYTPQVVVNGKEQFVGSDNVKLHNAINNELKQASATNLSILASKENDHSITVSYKTTGTGDLNIVLVQLQAQNQIGAGENHGVTLHHVNIVRDVKTIPLKTGEGTTSFDLPQGLIFKDCAVIAFTQNENDLRITSAAEASIE